MHKMILKPAALALSLTLLISQAAWASPLNDQALALAGQQKFDQALNVLSQESAELKAGYDHRFLKARILSWAGDYGPARAELSALMAEYPGNADLQLAMGNLDYYQGNLKAAAGHYQAVLDKYPNYTDARTGLENVRKAQASPRRETGHTWRIDGGAGLSDFDVDELSNWDEQFLRVEYVPGDLAFHGSVQRYKRFGVSDVQLRGGIADAVRGGWDWGIDGGFTPDAKFRPDVSAGGRLGRAITLQNGAVLYPNVTYQYDDYESGGIHNIQPGVTAYLDDGLILTGRLIGTLQKREKDQLGWLVQGRMPASDRLQLNLGYARAPEAINGTAITTESLFGGLTYGLQDDLDIHLNLARDDRENSYVRNSVNVGFTHKR